MSCGLFGCQQQSTPVRLICDQADLQEMLSSRMLEGATRVTAICICHNVQQKHMTATDLNTFQAGQKMKKRSCRQGLGPAICNQAPTSESRILDLQQG